ncbi:MAG: hypothetical protein AB1480_15130, partial [Nitrospirota bacterium]
MGYGYFYAIGEVGYAEYVSLLQGDALTSLTSWGGVGHIILFNRYIDSGGIESMEQTPWRAQRISYTWSQLSSLKYRPIRRNLVEGSFTIGDRVEITADGVNVRPCAGFTGCDPIPGAERSKGDRGTIIDGPQDVEKFRWWKIRYDDEVTGWTAEGYLLKISGETLSVTPLDDLTSSGNQGGPFSPSSKNYTLQNTGGSS